MSDVAKGGRGLAIILAAALAALTGCATNAPKPSELNKGIRKVAFVQHGTGPLRYEARAVDGKTFWAGSSNVNFVPATHSRADAQAAAGANLITLVASSIARESMKDDPQFYERTMRGMVGDRAPTDRIAAAVFPHFAQAWGAAVQPATVLSADAPLVRDGGVYAGPETDADLVLAFQIDKMVVLEKLSVGAAFKVMFTFGLGDREVVPILESSVTAFMRDKGELRQVWRLNCPLTSFAFAPSDVKWSALVDNPALGAPLIDRAVPIAIDNCRSAIAENAR